MATTLAVLGFRGADRFRQDLKVLEKKKQENGSQELDKLGELIKQLSAPSRGDVVFLKCHEASRTLMFSFDLENGQDASAVAAANVLDERIGKARDRLVDGVTISSEQDFYFNYFSNVTALLASVFTKDDDKDEVIAEVKTSIRALIRVEKCASLMAKLCWHEFSWEKALDLDLDLNLDLNVNGKNANSGAENDKKESSNGNANENDPKLEQNIKTTTEGKKMNQEQEKAIKLLEPVFSRFKVSKADVISLAGCIAIEEMGGPKIAWRFGRKDEEESDCYVDARSYFLIQEKVALSWLLMNKNKASKFDNSFFIELEQKGENELLTQYPPDMHPWIDLYANDEVRFSQDFACAFTKLQEWKYRFEDYSGKRRNRDKAKSKSTDQEEEENGPLLFRLPEKLAMFDFTYAQSLPVSRIWAKVATNQSDQILQRVRNLTKRSSITAAAAAGETMSKTKSLEVDGSSTSTNSTNGSKSENGTNGGMENRNGNTASTRKSLEKGGQSSSSSLSSISSSGSMTSISTNVNLQVFKTLHPDTPEDFVFDLNDPLDRNAALLAGIVDKTLTKFKPSLVPKISEAEFYRNYFSHVYNLRKELGEKSKPIVVKVFVGSKNPVKINAAKRGFLSAFQNDNRRYEFYGMEAPSGVDDQPMGDDETRRGALNRAMYCRDQRVDSAPKAANSEFYVGLEGGLQDNEDEMLCMAWIAVVSNNGSFNSSRTATFTIPPALSSLVRKGIELGRADDIVYGKTNSKQKGGTVGTLTSNQIDRTAYYAHAVILALAPFSSPTYHI